MCSIGIYTSVVVFGLAWLTKGSVLECKSTRLRGCLSTHPKLVAVIRRVGCFPSPRDLSGSEEEREAPNPSNE